MKGKGMSHPSGVGGCWVGVDGSLKTPKSVNDKLKRRLWVEVSNLQGVFVFSGFQISVQDMDDVAAPDARDQTPVTRCLR